MGLQCGANAASARASQKRKALITAFIVLAMMLALVAFAGCSCKKTATKPGTVLADNVPVTAFNLQRGDTVEVLGTTEDGYYQVKYTGDSGSVAENGKGSSTLLVEKWLVRLESESAPAETKAFSKEGCQLFDNPYLSGNAIATPEVDTELTVCDTFERCAFVKLSDGKTGYVSSAFLGTEKEPEESAEEDSASSGSYGYYSYSDAGEYYEEGTASSSGGSSGWTGGEIDLGLETGQDGEDMSLSSLLSTVGIVDVAYAADSSTTQSGGKGTVLADNTKSYIAFLDRGDAVDMVVQSTDGSSQSVVAADGTVHVLIDGQIGSVPTNLVRDNESASYAVWKGYATADAKVYGDYALLGDIRTCEINTEVTVVDDIENCYVVQVGDLTGYMAKDTVSATENEEVVEETVEDSGYSSYSYSYSYYGGSSEGTEVDAGNTGSAQSVIEAATNGGWTEEKL